MRWVVSISIFSLLVSAAVGKCREAADPLAGWKDSVTEWPESLGEKSEYDPSKRQQ
jgi:hypothetical protein